MSARRQHAHNGMAAGGRPIRIPRSVDSVRSHLKRHLVEEGRRLQDLAEAWTKAGGISIKHGGDWRVTGTALRSVGLMSD
ncbi:hypothetical protein [Stenotrophomonas forensis]|uniref:hypothetical protein n=1 Tax=Stenotrophomonas forensis TaxID=2871169 RepID=UPI0039C6D731